MRQIPAAMRRDDLQTGEAVERPLEDQVRQRDRGLGRQGDRVRQPAIPFQPIGEFRDGLRMNEQHGAEFLGLGPDRMEFRVGEFLAGDAAADRGAAQPLFFHRGFELLDGEIRELQRQRGEGGETVGLRRAEFGELFVLYPDDLGGEVAILAIPERVDRQHLHVDALCVHRLEALVERGRDKGLPSGLLHRRLEGRVVVAHQLFGLVEQAMGMDVDRLDALAVDHDRQARSAAPPGLLRAGRVEQRTAAKRHAGRRGGRLQEVSSARHFPLRILNAAGCRAPVCSCYIRVLRRRLSCNNNALSPRDPRRSRRACVSRRVPSRRRAGRSSSSAA